MALDTNDAITAILNVLANNTATMILSLTATNIVTIKSGDARSIPLDIGKYPAVMVQLTSERERFAQIGQRLNEHTLEFAIVPLVYLSTGATESDNEVRTLTKNIKSVLKSNISLSGTAYSSLPESVDYFVTDLDGTYLSSALITFRAEYRST